MDADVKLRLEIAKHMRAKSISQAELARKLGVKPQSVYPVLKGSRGKQPKSLLDILDALDLELTVRPKKDSGTQPPAWLKLAGSWKHPNTPADMSASHDRYDAEALREELEAALPDS